jgi:RNA polymerase sigma-70 factor (ECF subfamily)
MLQNYIYVIVKRLIMNYLRDHKPSESLESEVARELQSTTWGGQDLIVIANETRNRMQDIIARMPAQRRTVFAMSRNQGMTNKQIAEALQISVKTVERHMTLALAELRENIS